MKIRDAIYEEILSTYHPKVKNKSWYFSDSPEEARDTTISVLEVLARVYLYASDTKIGEYYRDNVLSNIQQAIWMPYPGGTTAGGCAKRICDRLNISYDYSAQF